MLKDRKAISFLLSGWVRLLYFYSKSVFGLGSAIHTLSSIQSKRQRTKLENNTVPGTYNTGEQKRV